jgi:hypothetical protein
MNYEIGYNPDISGDDGYEETIEGDYEVGDYEVGQDDVEALLGAAKRAARRRGLPARRGGRPMMSPHRGLWGGGKTVVQERRPTKDREWAVGFDSGVAIAAGASATITQRPQVLFRAERLVIPATTAASFLISDIKVGNKSQTVSSGSLPAAAFSETAFGVRLLLDTCAVAMDLVLIVNNFSALAARFVAAMVGKAVD